MGRRNKKNREYNPALLAFLTAAGILLLYVLLAYPVYTHMKMRILKDAYEEIAEMDLSSLDEEDEEVLQNFYTENLEILITDERFTLVYSNKMGDMDKQIDKYVKRRLEQYQEEPLLSVRTYESLRVLRLRAKVTQNGGTYYLYIRKQIRSVREMIVYTTIYFLAAFLLSAAVWHLALRRRNLRVLFASPNERDRVLEAQNQLDEAQKEFVANVSHELKTPLAVISGQVEMLQSMGEEIDRDYYFSSIREEIEKMSDLVGNLLDVTIMEHHMEEMKRSQENLSDMMEYLLLKYDALFRKNRIKLTSKLEKDCIVYANRMYLEQAVNNYIMNAFQHTAQGKHMCIFLEKQENTARISVYNEGAQIADEDMERIWQSFYKSARGQDQENPRLRNAGLGLFMVKKIVEQHNGTCGVENREKGVEFWMRIPLLP